MDHMDDPMVMGSNRERGKDKEKVPTEEKADTSITFSVYLLGDRRV